MDDNPIGAAIYLSSGSATSSPVPGLSGGSHDVTAVFSSSDNFARSIGYLKQTVGVPTTTTTITSSANPCIYGQSVTFTATISGPTGAGSPSGTVTFKDETTVLGTGALSGGQATFAASGLTPSATTHTISAVYEGDANFGASTSSTLHLTVNQVVLIVAADGKSYVYGESLPSFTASYSGFVNGDTAASLSGTVAFDSVATSSSGVGNYDVTPKGLTSNSYAITFVKGNLSVSPRQVTITADAKTKAYGDSDPTLTYQVTSGSLLTGDTFTGALIRDPGENVGTYAIKQGGLQLGANYALTYAGANLTVSTRTVTVTADAKTKAYGDYDPTLTYQVTNGSLVTGDTFSGALTRDPGENVGTYAIKQGSLQLGANYALTYAGANLTVSARTVTITADAKSKAYGDSDPTLTYQVTSGSLATGDTFTGALTRDAGVNPGSYAIKQGTLQLSSNYALTYLGANLTISARPVTVTADAKSKAYGDSDPTLTYQVTSGSLVTGDTFTGALIRDAGEHVGPHAIKQGGLQLGANYALTYLGANLTIAARPVTVTADAKSKNYGDSDPTFTYQVTSGSLVTGDTFTGALTRDPGESIGTYAIRQGTLQLDLNYILTYVGTNLTISAPPIAINTRTNVTYSTLQAAYDGAADGDSILCLNVQLNENITAWNNITVTIVGGYLPGFSSDTGMTTITGSVVVNSGTVNLGNCLITN